MVIQILISFIGGFLVTLRVIRWVAWVQQKEYRPDRLWLWLLSNEGSAELRRLPQLTDFKRANIRRPKLTLRSVVTLVGTMGGVGGICLVGLWSMQDWGFAAQVLCMLGGFAIVYLLVPLVAMTVGVIPGFFVWYYTQWLLYSAGRRVHRQQPLIIGITGSYGKTATKILLEHVLSQKFTVFMPPRSHNTVYSISQSILRSYSNQQVAIIEYAAYKMGEIARLAKQIKPNMAILTGLTEQHLGLFGSLENIKIAKSELVNAVPAGNTVYCANPAGAQILEATDASRWKVIPLWKETSLQGSLTARGTLTVTQGTHTIATQLVGLQYLDAVRTVWTVARDLGVSDKKIIAALENFNPTTGFTRIYNLASGTTVLDDGGTANPAGFSAAITLAKNLRGHHKILVTSGIVDLGVRSHSIHQQLAEEARPVFDQVWYVGQVGLEEFQAIIKDRLITDQTTITASLAQLSPDAVLVLEGRMPAWFTKML